MNKIIWLVALALFPVLLRGGVGSYASIDEKMTEAFNSQPKRAVDAYIYAMQLVERSNLDSGKKARKWREKGQAVISVSCFSAVNTAIDNKKTQVAYMWCLRGLENGSPKGKINNVSLRRVYLALRTMRRKLEQRFPDLQQKGAANQLNILDWRTIKHDSKLRPKHVTDPAGREKVLYEVVEGVDQDSENRLFIKVRAKSGLILKIVFFTDKGWAYMPQPGFTPTQFYPTWQACAKANNAEKTVGLSVNVKPNKAKQKKLKAAIMGVLYYLQQQEEENNSKLGKHWSRSGRKIIMQNRMMVQRRGLTR